MYILTIFNVALLLFDLNFASIFDSEPLFTIKWFNSRDSFLDSYFFDEELSHLPKSLKPVVDEDDSVDVKGKEQALQYFESFDMKAKNNGDYKCYMPNDAIMEQNEEAEYDGPGPIELIEEIFHSEACSYLISSYWIYQLCHGKQFRQYHEEKASKIQQYYLGALEGFWQNMQYTDEHYAKRWPKKLLKSIQIGDTAHKYVEVLMGQGTPCDIKNDEPRRVTVRYICVPGSRLELVDIREVVSCQYEATVAAPPLCRHPDFTPNIREENRLYCVAQDKNKVVKLPSTMNHNFHIIMGDEIYHEPFPRAPKPQGTVVKAQQPSHVVPSTPVSDEEGDENEDGSDDDDDGDEDETDEAQDKEEKFSQAIASTVFRVSADGVVQRREQNVGLPQLFPEDSQDVLVGRELKRFVEAVECVKGGRGWWKHEFCFNQHIYHLHYENNPQTKQPFVQKRIILGIWDRNKHINWAKNQPKEAYMNLEAKKPHVTLYYGQGDICHENNQYRHTLVNLRCAPSLQSATSISVSLTEPKLCSYVMTVDSGMFCELIKHVDEYGVPVKGQ